VVSQREIRALAEPSAAQRLRGGRFVILGAGEAELKWFADHGAEVATAPEPQLQDKIGPLAVVIWNAAHAAANHPSAAAILRYVENGGRLVILDHRHWDWTELLDVKIHEMGKGLDSPASRAFPFQAMENHLLLAGLPAEALRRWNGLPGTIASSHLAADVPGGQPIVWADNPAKIVAMDIPRGKGHIFVCLLEVKRRLQGDAYDPAAVQVLLNLLTPPATGKDSRP
jgi:hypothetical protein